MHSEDFNKNSSENKYNKSRYKNNGYTEDDYSKKNYSKINHNKDKRDTYKEGIHNQDKYNYYNDYKDNYIDLIEVIRIIKKRLLLLIVVPLIFAGITWVISEYFMQKIYEARTSFYIVLKQPTAKDAPKPGITYSDLQASQLLVEDYREFIKQNVVIDKVLDKLQYSQIMTSQQLADMIDIKMSNNTRILEMTVRNSSPIFAADIANKVMEVFSDKVIEFLDADSVRVIDKAKVMEEPVVPNIKINIVIGFVCGLTLMTGLVFIREFHIYHKSKSR